MDVISSPESIWEIIVRLGLAMLFGAAVGANREWLEKPAGLRTHALVGLGGALFTLVGLLLSDSDPAATLRTTISRGTISTWRISCSRMLSLRMK